VCRVPLGLALVLSGCIGSMVRAPAQIPADGKVECTDTYEQPITAAVIATLSAATIAYAANHPEWALENGGILWVPVAGILSVGTFIGVGEGLLRVEECKEAKQRGAAHAKIAQRDAQQAQARSAARAEANALSKRAAAAARADDCVSVRTLDPQVRALDVEFHALVFLRDIAIARCLQDRPRDRASHHE
jgi:hypothetical protein